MPATSTRGSSVPIGAAVPSLVRWGLSSDADLVFRTITTFGPRASGTLSAELGLPTPRIEDALAELRACGAATAPGSDRTRGTRCVWTARPPAEVVSTLRTRRIHLACGAAKAGGGRSAGPAVDPATSAVVAAGPPPLVGEIGEGVRYLATRAAARQRLAALVDMERHEHLAINTELAFDAASLRTASPLDRQLVERGVRLRVLGRPPADGDPMVHADAVLLRQATCHYRESPEVPLKLVIVDHRIAFFPADPDDFDRGYLEISQPAVVRALMLP